MWLLLTLIFLYYTNYIERKKYNFPLYTPMNLLCLPTLILMILSYPQERYIGYLAVSQTAISFYFYCILFFWVGAALCIFSNKKRSLSFSSKEYNTKSVPTNAFNIICFFFVLILLANLNQILGSRSLFQIEDEEFAQNGLVGHIGELVVFFIIYYMGSFKEKAFKTPKIIAISLLVILLVIKILMSVKAQAVIPFIAGLLFLLIRGHINLKSKAVLMGVVLSVALFTIPAVMFNTKEDSVAYVVHYFVWYLYAGVSGLTGFINEHPNMQIGQSPGIVIRFFQNSYSAFFGNGIIIKGGNLGGYADISTERVAFQHGSNVQMLFGEVFMNAGFIVTALYFIIIGYISYKIFFNHKKHLMLTILYAYLGAGLVMSFFSGYVLGQTFYEMCVFTYLMYLFAKYFKPIRTTK